MRGSIIFLLAGMAFAQNDSVFRATTQLVRIDVAAQDKNGQPVSDLTRDDFELFVSHKPQAIATFTVTSATPALPEPLPRGTFSNRQAAVEVTQGRYTVFLLDWRNTNWQLQSFAHQQLIKMLTDLPEGEKVALYLINDRLQIVQEFTADHERLKAKVETLYGQLQEPQGNRLQSLQATHDAITAFRAVAKHLDGISGQKVLVWVSMGFLSESEDIDDAVHALGNANIVVESTDPTYLNAHLLPELGPTRRYGEPLAEIAHRTGGQHFVGDESNDLAARLKAAATDRATSYELGYYAGEDLPPGLQPFEIHCRRPGVTLRYREGFFVDKHPLPPPPDARTAAQETLEGAVDAVAIPLMAKATRTMGNKGSIIVLVNIDARALALRQEGDHWRGKISILARFAGDEDEQFGSVPMDIPALNFTQEQHEKFLRDGLPRRFTMKLPAGASTLRVLVRDEDSGNPGSVTIPADDLPEF